MAKDKGKHAWYARWYVGLAAALVLILGLVMLSFTGTPVDRLRTFHIPAASMVPTLRVDDYIAALMPVEGAAPIRPCDVTVFKKPGSPQAPEVDYVKRIVALAGDRVAYVDGRLRLNGQLVPREKIRLEGTATIYRETLPNGCSYLIQEMDDRGMLDNTGEIVVPPGHFYALGDNRDDSLDSRVPNFGPIPNENYRARPLFVYWAKDWHRIGTLL
jgi:signal peptidase I